MGKGSRARPFEVPKEQYDVNWERIFGMKKKEPEPKKDENKKTK
jgi:hypothetical protein